MCVCVCGVCVGGGGGRGGSLTNSHRLPPDRGGYSHTSVLSGHRLYILSFFLSSSSLLTVFVCPLREIRVAFSG